MRRAADAHVKLDPSSIYPLLRTKGFAESKGIEGAFRVPVYSGPGAPLDKNAPEVYFVSDVGEKVAYLTWDLLPDLPQEALLATALTNLRARKTESEWLNIDLAPKLDGKPIWFRVNDFYAAEGLLLDEVLSEAHNLTKAENLLMATAIRGQICVCEFLPDTPYLELFARATIFKFFEELFSKSGDEISPTVWTVHSGQITGTIEFPEQLTTDLREQARSEAASGR